MRALLAPTGAFRVLGALSACGCSVERVLR